MRELIGRIYDRCEEALEDWPGVQSLILNTTMLAVFMMMAGGMILALYCWMKVFIFFLGHENGMAFGILGMFALFWILGHIWGDLAEWRKRRKQK